MTVQFPAIRPANRQYEPPTVPITEIRSESGVTYRRRRGSLPVDANLVLRFDARPATDWTLIEDAWLDSDCGAKGLYLPAAVWAPDPAPSLPGLQWRFIPGRPPQKSQDRDLRGRVGITVELRAVAM